MKEKMNILLVSAEAAPFAKVGGLADVAGSLPAALVRLGHDARVILPNYQRIEEKFPLETVAERIPFTLRGLQYEAGIKSHVRNGVTYYFVDIPFFFRRSEIYMYNDDGERFTAFCRGVLHGLGRLDWKPDVIHCNDWQTGLIPAYMKTLFADDEFYKNVGTLFTIHNLAYQGTFPKYYLEVTGLPEEVFHFSRMEFFGKLNFMKGGVYYSDRVNTVSRKYRDEILTPEYGEGLDSMLIEHQEKLTGIINGIDMDEFNPETDTDIYRNYSKETLEGKNENKAGLLAELGLPNVKSRRIPLIGMITRLASQKGFDILEKAMDRILAMDAQLVVLGTGDPAYHKMLERYMKKYPKKVSAKMLFDAKLAQKIYAGSDMFLMPSKFEPCGLGQLISLRYGTIPIVRATGGLADTIVNFNGKKAGNGFVFEVYNAAALLKTVTRAVETYATKSVWDSLVRNAMECDFSWVASASKYEELYGRTLK